MLNNRISNPWSKNQQNWREKKTIPVGGFNTVLSVIDYLDKTHFKHRGSKEWYQPDRPNWYLQITTSSNYRIYIPFICTWNINHTYIYLCMTIKYNSIYLKRIEIIVSGHNRIILETNNNKNLGNSQIFELNQDTSKQSMS